MPGADNDVHMGRSLKDQILILLRHASHDADNFGRPISFAELQSTERAVDFMFGMFPHTAGVEQHGVGIPGIVGQFISFFAQRRDNQFAVQHVHLAANGFDVNTTVMGC